MMDLRFDGVLMDQNHILHSKGLNEGGRVQKYVDSEVLRLSVPYLPFQQGELKASGETGTIIGSGEACYNTPKARYLYYGKVMAGRAPKRVTAANLKYHGGPMRGAFWFERMKVAHMEGILRGAGRLAGGE